MKCLLDTSANFALVNPRDTGHAVARAFVREPGLRLHTTAAILAESFTLIRSKLGHRPAIGLVRSTLASNVITVHHSGPDEDRLVWSRLEELRSIPLSYADASLIVLGERLRIRSVFAFDDAFRLAGLEMVPA